LNMSLMRGLPGTLTHVLRLLFLDYPALLSSQLKKDKGLDKVQSFAAVLSTTCQLSADGEHLLSIAYYYVFQSNDICHFGERNRTTFAGHRDDRANHTET
jgi:hypothetical protein